jgi:hypothetical protein
MLGSSVSLAKGTGPVGGLAETTLVSVDATCTEPSLFVAVTSTLIVRPSSPAAIW